MKNVCVYPFNDYRLYLMHHGILGQKWGIRNGPPYPLDIGDHSPSEKKAGWENSLKKHGVEIDDSDLAKKLLNKSSFINLDRWGQNPNTNVLYVTGLSGSGKSTVGLSLSKIDSIEYVNLDSYLSEMSKESRDSLQNKSFNKYLDKTVQNWKNVIKPNGKLDYKIVDDIADSLEGFGKQQHKTGKSVIAEGVQIYTPTLHEDLKFYKSKPTIVVNTNAFMSNYRGSLRDSESGKLSETADLMLYRLGYTAKSAKELSNFKKTIDMK